jgi:hypothetical protein
MKTKLLGLAAFLFLFSCSEDEQTTPPQELPIKITRWNGSGNMDYMQIISYDSKKRISEIDITESNTSLNRKIFYTYTSGKVIRYINYTDPAQTDTKYVHYYGNGKIIKEEFFIGNNLDRVFTWTNNFDGSKTAKSTKSNGELVNTFRYHFNSIGNCTSVRVDQADPTKTDFTVTFDNFDSHPRALFHHFWMEPWTYITGVFKEPLVPNNPGTYTNTPDGQAPSTSHVFDYEYDSNGNVVFQKTFNAGSLLNSTVYEYATIE